MLRPPEGSPAKHFNHNDLYHIVQMGAVCLLYRGARLFEGPLVEEEVSGL